MGNAYSWGQFYTFNNTWLLSNYEPPPGRNLGIPPVEITHDPLDGFPNGRKRRVMVATKEELESARIPPLKRDYCAHILIKFKTCRQDNYPLVYRCAHEKHEYEKCEYDDYVLRMKEVEREKRLRERDERIAKKQRKLEREAAQAAH